MKNSQSLNNSIVMVQHNSILDHKADEIEASFLTEDKTWLEKQNFEFRDNWNVLENHDTLLKFNFALWQTTKKLSWKRILKM